MFAPFTANEITAQTRLAIAEGETERMDLSNAGRVQGFLNLIGRESRREEVGRLRNGQPLVKIVLA